MGKHIDALGTIEKFKAPWETDAGEVDIEKPRLKTYLYNLALDKAKAQDAREEFEEKVTAATKERDDATAAKKAAEKKLADSDATGEIASLTEKLAEAETRATTAEIDLLKVQVAADKGLNPLQAARLQGTTKEELEADADAIAELFGLKAAPKDDDDDNDDEDGDDEDFGLLRRTPRVASPTQNRDTPGDDGLNSEADFDKVVAGFGGRNF